MESNIKDFRPIALLNVEGKLIFSLVSRRLEAQIITINKLINTSVQKGCMEKVHGCWEHMSMVWSALKDARSDKLDLATIWLDIANASGSIPHRVIFFPLERYGFLSLKTTMLEFIVNRFQNMHLAIGTNICVVYLLVAHCP